MPNRIIREGWIDSERIGLLDAHAECFFLRLCLKADDHGRFSANTKLLRSALYPLRDDVRDADMACRLAAAQDAGLVTCYEVAGKRYVQIADFRQQIRSRSKFPDAPLLSSGVAESQQLQANDHLRARSNTHTNSNSNSETRAREKRLHGIPENAEAVVAYGLTLNPKIPASLCREFFGYYEGQARTNENGEVFWITKGETVITNWKAKLPSFKGNRGNEQGNRGAVKSADPAVDSMRRILAKTKIPE